MKKRFFLAIITFIFLMLLAGCRGNSTVKDPQLKTDLETYKKSSFLKDGEKITAVSMEKRQTSEEEKRDTVWCVVQTEDGKRAYEKEMVLTYIFYDEGGWILEEVKVNDKKEWVISPLVGVSNDEVSASLQRINVTVDDETWYVSNNIKSISVDKQDTDLEKKTDNVTVTVTLDDVVMEASGKIELRYTFTDGAWALDEISGNKDFTAKAKPGVALDVTEKMLLEALTAQERSFEYGIPAEGIFSSSDIQTVKIQKDEIVDFEIVRKESRSKGTEQVYFCHCILQTPYVEFSLDIYIEYIYSSSGEWGLQPIIITAECSSVNIAGSWKGTNMYDRACELNITNVDGEGNITGIYSDYGDSNHKSYSYYVSGKIDFVTLRISLNAGDVIQEPYQRFKADDISAKLNLDRGTISGHADLNFTLKQQ